MLEIKNTILESFLLIVILLLLSTDTTATVSAPSINNSSTLTYPYNFYSESLETRLDTLIESGTISESQAATILDIYYTYEITTKQDMKTQLDVLVTEKTITQNQEYSILNLFIDSNYEASASPNGLSYNTTSSTSKNQYKP